MPKEKEEPKKAEPIEPEVVVVKKLVEQPVRTFEADDGKTYTTLTVEEALTEILLNTRALRKLL